jgi:hypothetical protein
MAVVAASDASVGHDSIEFPTATCGFPERRDLVDDTPAGFGIAASPCGLL